MCKCQDWMDSNTNLHPVSEYAPPGRGRGGVGYRGNSQSIKQTSDARSAILQLMLGNRIRGELDVRMVTVQSLGVPNCQVCTHSGLQIEPATFPGGRPASSSIFPPQPHCSLHCIVLLSGARWDVLCAGRRPVFSSYIQSTSPGSSRPASS